MKRGWVGYISLAVAIILLDQLTKWFALRYWHHERIITSFLSFKVTINRGISWGLLSAAETHTLLFLAITSGIILLTFGLGLYAYRRYPQGYPIMGELLVVAGSLSNILDRCVRHGVVDFIVLRWGEYVWPVFNIADMAIVCGVGILFFQYLTRSDDRA